MQHNTGQHNRLQHKLARFEYLALKCFFSCLWLNCVLGKRTDSGERSSLCQGYESSPIRTGSWRTCRTGRIVSSLTSLHTSRRQATPGEKAATGPTFSLHAREPASHLARATTRMATMLVEDPCRQWMAPRWTTNLALAEPWYVAKHQINSKHKVKYSTTSVTMRPIECRKVRGCIPPALALQYFGKRFGNISDTAPFEPCFIGWVSVGYVSDGAVTDESASLLHPVVQYVDGVLLTRDANLVAWRFLAQFVIN